MYKSERISIPDGEMKNVGFRHDFWTREQIFRIHLIIPLEKANTNQPKNVAC